MYVDLKIEDSGHMINNVELIVIPDILDGKASCLYKVIQTHQEMSIDGVLLGRPLLILKVA